jgi:hypothetical protein
MSTATAPIKSSGPDYDEIVRVVYVYSDAFGASDINMFKEAFHEEAYRQQEFVLPAHAAHLQPSGVDSVHGGEIHYQEATDYDAALTYARDAWNAVGSVDFKPDTASTVNDLQCDDYFEVSSRGAYWQEYAGEDNIWFNDYWFAGDTVTNRRAAVAHENGQALGLDDHYSNTWNNTIMDNCFDCDSSVPTAPTSHDRADYHDRWG